MAEQLPQNIMTFIFHIYASQELYQSNEQIHNEVTQIENIFPNSSFLKTQRALLFYHSKGTSLTSLIVVLLPTFPQISTKPNASSPRSSNPILTVSIILTSTPTFST